MVLVAHFLPGATKLAPTTRSNEPRQHPQRLKVLKVIHVERRELKSALLAYEKLFGVATTADESC
jgi:hypothetical protein